jgi:hypothetical protein
MRLKEMDLRQIGSEDGGKMELAQGHEPSQALV